MSAVLRSLQSQGLHIIYNSQLVPDDLVVLHEPQAQGGLPLARELLAQHALALSEVAPQVYAVISQQPSARREVQAKQSSVPQSLEEIVVQASRYTLAAAQPGASHTFLTQDQLNALPRLGDETLRAVQRLPGASSNGLSSLAAIRGGDPTETEILLDGLRLYEPFHLKNFLNPVSLLDARTLSQVDVYAGGFPVQYGERMSAIIDAHSVHPTAPRYRELGLSLFHASGLFATSFDGDRGRALLSARRSNLGELASLSEQDFGKPTYADAFMRVDYAFSPATTLAFHTLASEDRVTARTSSGRERAKAEYYNYYGWATLTHQWPDSSTTQVLTSYTRVHNERSGSISDPGRRAALVDDQREFHVAGVRIEHRFADAGAFEHRLGAEGRALQGRYHYRSDVSFAADYPFPGYPAATLARRSNLHPQGSEWMGYWSTRWHVTPQWTVESGIRVDTQTYDDSGDREHWSPRINVLYEYSPRTRWRASWGRFFQTQTINELQVEDGVERFSPAQRVDHSILSFEHAISDRLELRIEAYQKDYANPSPRFENLLDPLKLLPEAEFDRVRVDADGARARGMEVLLNLHELHGFSAWLGYAWSRAEDRFDEQRVPRSWDQRHAVTAGVRWSRGPWDLALTETYHSGWPTTGVAVVGGTVVLGQRNGERLGDFNAIDFRVTRTFALSRGALDVFFEATNLLSRENPCCVEYSMHDEQEDEHSSSGLHRELDTWLPLVPSFGVLWRY